jgi:3-deoxy-manno-octulosonate cytidylyltransferase (CMP-KDO synthetase)
VRTGECDTGTDRIVQALRLMDPAELGEYDVIVNVQGDEPGVNPRHIDACIAALREGPPETVMSTLATPITDEREAYSRDVVKCVSDCNG